MMTKAVPAAPVFERRWSVWAAGFGGSQTTDGNTVTGSNGATSRIFGTAAGADVLIRAEHPGRLCAGRRRHQFQRFKRRRFGSFRPVPGRRFPAPHGRRVLHPGRAGVWLAGRHHRPHRDDRRHRPASRALQRQRLAPAASKPASRFVAPGDMNFGVTPYAAGAVHRIRLPAYAESVLSGANTFALGYASKNVTDSAANSACAPTDRWRWPMRSLPCADGSPGP